MMKESIRKRLLALLGLMLVIHPVFSCFILVVTDGERVLVGNHEDWYARDAEVVFIPAEEDHYGMVLFDFESEGFAQGGMNTEGLFFDGTASPFVPIDFSGKAVFDGYIWQALLERCANVDEAIEFLSPYQLQELQEVHIMLCDRSGRSVIIGAYDGELNYHFRERAYQVLANFNISDPEYGGEQPCPRYGTAMRYLESDSTATVANVRKILADTHQEELSVYSNIYDLTNGEVYVYSLRNFEKEAKFNLAEELAKGKHALSIPALFSE